MSDPSGGLQGIQDFVQRLQEFALVAYALAFAVVGIMMFGPPRLKDFVNSIELNSSSSSSSVPIKVDAIAAAMVLLVGAVILIVLVGRA